MSKAQTKLRNELFAVIWRYSQESDVTVLETITVLKAILKKFVELWEKGTK